MFRRSAGILIPLFSIRTEDNLGCGEIGGLSAMVDFALSAGARAVQLLPINETAPGEASPYSALSLFAIDPVYVSVPNDDAPETPEIRAARRTARHGQISRKKIRAAKVRLLEHAFNRFRAAGSASEREGFEAFAARHRDWLHEYALFRTLKDRFKFAAWNTWPDGLRNRDPEAIENARRELRDEIAKFEYFQFLANRQWHAARDQARARGAMLGGDLAFAPAPDSADVWANQDLFNLDRTVGTPPDAFSAEGQRWGLPMPNWERMRADGFKWWRMRTRNAAELFDLFRVDHVVGLYRTFSFGPNPGEPGEFFPADEEAQRAQGEEIIRSINEEAGSSLVIAEDLGTVPPFVRTSLTRLGVPGYKVFRWEKENWNTPEEHFIDPSVYRELSIATTGTHDTETLATWWRESAEHERRMILKALGLDERFNPRRARMSGRLLESILEALYASPSMLVIVPVQDLFGWLARINLPGTIGPRNWNYRLPFLLRPLGMRPVNRDRVKRIREIAIRTGRFDG